MGNKDDFDFEAHKLEVKRDYCILEKKLVKRLLVLIDTVDKNDKEMLEIQVLSKALHNLSSRLNIQIDDR